MDALGGPIFLRAEHWEQMKADVSRRAPEEACGLVAGQARRSMFVFPVENSLHSPVRYRLDAEQQVRVLLLMEEKGWDLLAIYHSHPAGPATPSQTDLEEAAYPEAVWLIWQPDEGGWTCRGFWIVDAKAWEARIKLIE